MSVGDRPGRSTAGSILTDWWLDFGHPDLLSWAPGETSIAVALDANVFLDLYLDPPTGVSARTRDVLESLVDRIDLVVTPELFNELSRRDVTDERRRLLGIANSYPRPSADPADVDAWTEKIRSAASLPQRLRPRDRSDLRHIAWAAASGVQVVLTRDIRAIIRFSEAARTIANVDVCHPETLTAVLHEREDAGAYAPAALAGTRFEVQEVSDQPHLSRCFVDTAGGERQADFQTRIQQLSSRRPESALRLVTDAVGEPTALLGTLPATDALSVPVARLKRGVLEATVAAQLVDQVRHVAQQFKLQLMVVDDPGCAPLLRKAFLSAGFVSNGEVLTGLTIDARIDSGGVDDLIRQASARVKTAPGWTGALDATAPPAVLEHAFRPLRIVDADLPTWIVPIKPRWASDLFGHPEMLIARDDRLGMSIEHVYYKKGVSGEKPPGRVLWYVSQPQSEVFACSLLTDVRDAPADELFRRYQRLGVYALTDVRQCVRPNGKARALNVTDTELFRSPVPYQRLKDIAGRYGVRLNVQGARRISSDLFAEIIKEAQD